MVEKFVVLPSGHHFDAKNLAICLRSLAKQIEVTQHGDKLVAGIDIDKQTRKLIVRLDGEEDV